MRRNARGDDPKKFIGFRFDSVTTSRLKRFAKRKDKTMTAVLEDLIDRHCLSPKEEA